MIPTKECPAGVAYQRSFWHQLTEDADQHQAERVDQVVENRSLPYRKHIRSGSGFQTMGPKGAEGDAGKGVQASEKEE